MQYRILLIFLFLLISAGFYQGAGVAQESKLDGLTGFLKEKMVSPEARPLIIQHLNESGADDYLTELVTWAKEEFPDLRDEHGHWKTDSTGLKLGIIHSIHYFVNELPAPLKSQRYLEILDELRGNEYISFHLTQMASLFVDDESLKSKAFELMTASEAAERARGALMICDFAASEEAVMRRCEETLLTDQNSNVRSTILYAMTSLHDPKVELQKRIILLHLHSLINDPSSDVQELVARHLLSFAATRRIITRDDLPEVLLPLVRTNDRRVREVLGRVAAHLTTDLSLGVEEDKITSALLSEFVSQVKSKKRRARGSINKQEIVEMWSSWWTPLIPKYSKPVQVVW